MIIFNEIRMDAHLEPCCMRTLRDYGAELNNRLVVSCICELVMVQNAVGMWEYHDEPQFPYYTKDGQ